MNAEELRKLAKKFAPVETQHKLIRLGPPTDGGYLIPDDIHGITACFSPGVETIAHFESDLLNKFGVNSHLADYSVEGPPQGFTPLSFSKKFLGSYNNDVYMTLEKWVTDQKTDGDLLLQMDIEGGEYDTLLSTPDDILKQFRIIVLEVHNLEEWINPRMYSVADAMITKLQQYFEVVHNHPNNWGKLYSLNGVEYPGTIEITLLRKDRCGVKGYAKQFPHPLDAPCAWQLPDVVLPSTFIG